MRGAAVLKYMKMPELLRDAGRGAVLLHQQMERGAVDRPLLLAQEDRAREGSAYLQPGAQGSSLFAHEVVLARVRTLQPVDEDLVGLGIVVAHLEQPDFRRPQAGPVGEL